MVNSLAREMALLRGREQELDLVEQSAEELASLWEVATGAGKGVRSAAGWQTAGTARKRHQWCW